jgi:hypothetical protein
MSNDKSSDAELRRQIADLAGTNSTCFQPHEPRLTLLSLGQINRHKNQAKPAVNQTYYNHRAAYTPVRYNKRGSYSYNSPYTFSQSRKYPYHYPQASSYSPNNIVTINGQNYKSTSSGNKLVKLAGMPNSKERISLLHDSETRQIFYHLTDNLSFPFLF